MRAAYLPGSTVERRETEAPIPGHGEELLRMLQRRVRLCFSGGHRFRIPALRQG